MDDAAFARLLSTIPKLKARQVLSVDRVLAEVREKTGAFLALETEDGATPPNLPYTRAVGEPPRSAGAPPHRLPETPVLGVWCHLHRAHGDAVGGCAQARGRRTPVGDDGGRRRGGCRRGALMPQGRRPPGRHPHHRLAVADAPSECAASRPASNPCVHRPCGDGRGLPKGIA